MLNLLIDRSNSFSAATGDALVLDGLGHTIHVTAAGSIAALAPLATALAMPAGGSTVLLEGLITAPLGTGIGAGPGSLVTIAAGGRIEAGGAIAVTGGDNAISNAGMIASSGLFALSLFSAVGDAASTIANAGTITGATTGLLLAADGLSLTNSGVIEAAADAVVASGAGLSIESSGLIRGGFSGLTVAGANALISNTGTIEAGAQGVRLLSLEGGSASLANTGTITAALAVSGRAGSETLLNSGTITGLVQLDGGADIYDGTGGVLIGRLELGSGDDRASGGAGSETIDGGLGVDTYDGARAAGPIVIDLDAGTLAGASEGADRLLGFESAIGSAFDDLLRGSGTANMLDGGAGNDLLAGIGGADTLLGGEGQDTLRGGAGQDLLAGGEGSDLFDLNSASESGPRGSQRDIILDFNVGLDRLDLSTIDANTEKSGNQRFKLIGEKAFSDTPRELRVVYSESGATLLGDIDGDGRAEFSVKLAGVSAIGTADLVL